MQLSTYDWKKAAAQVADDGSVERAFMDQAYGFLTNKAGKLMQDPFRLGFEVVYKNDSNTRMVGIFAFRVNDKIIYVPVFFINGDIKGTDLMYRQDTKTFVPLNEEWVTFLTEKNNYEPGIPVDRKEFTRANNHVRLEDIAYPPNYKRDKRASEESPDSKHEINTLGDIDMVIAAAFEKEVPAKGTMIADGEDKDDKALAESRKNAIKNLGKSGSIIRKFILEDGGIEAVNKLASLMENSFEFTEALVSNISEQDYMPDTLEIKSASDKENKPTLVLFSGRPGITEHSYLLKSADETKDKEKNPAVNKYAEKFFSQGYYLWDDRAPKDIVPVYKDNEENLEMIGSAGIYDILMSDGSFRKAVVAPLGKDLNNNNPSCVSIYGGGFNEGGVIENIEYNSSPRGSSTTVAVCFMDKDNESGEKSSVHGKFIKDQAQMLRDGDLEESMSTGKAYRIFDCESGSMTSPFYVKNKKETDGITSYEIVMQYCSSVKVLTHNPDFTENDIPTGFLGTDVRFVPVGVERFKVEKDTYDGRPNNSFYYKRIDSDQIGDSSTLNSLVTAYVKKASLLYDKNTDMYSWRTGPKQQTDYMDGMSMAVNLAVGGFHAEAVDEMLSATKKAGETTWFYGDPGMDKSAFPIIQNRDAIFRTTTNQDFKVNQEYPQSFILRTSKDSLQLPPQIVGDAYDPGMGVKIPEEKSSNSGVPKDQLMTMSPEQIAQFASSNNLPNVFEHGVVGSLVQVYDSISMIDKYIPDMEEALDRLGRILFLFYWKPRDFEDAYGADDMTNLENQILSNFKSFGTLVLDILKRSKKRKLGNVSMGS